MSHENIVQCLDAVEQALEHFAGSLEKAGFAAGAVPYTRMTDVILGQALQLQGNNEQVLNERFRQIVTLASRVHEQIHPYATAMERLLVLQEIVPPPVADVPPDSLAGQIVAVLAQTDRPLSVTAIRSAVGKGTRTLRAELKDLIDSGIVKQTGSTSRPIYGLAG